MATKTITEILQKLTDHNNVVVTERGDIAIASALCAVEKGTVLIPEEGGWLSYQKIPQKLGLTSVNVKCHLAKIDLDDLKEKSKSANALLYQNPGGYFADQPMKKIYDICKKNDCLVIMDVSGSIGTDLCDGRYADIMVASFRKWKLVDADVGGFISSNTFDLSKIDRLKDKTSLAKILKSLHQLQKRIIYLEQVREKVVFDLAEYDVVHPLDLGFVVVVNFYDEEERKSIVKYCKDNELEYTTCPRYIRLNQDAISIELKRLKAVEKHIKAKVKKK
ncbi:DegT/DnrJ/EryC1/StrS family aminotransferase [Candidatus Woesearchaeota archaeon]|nr:DegT/DnrJ/EryC1/StrS family aminotransferase [Candidatus Woesearchaeota archaeon]